jgi:hypothetical protein
MIDTTLLKKQHIFIREKRKHLSLLRLKNNTQYVTTQLTHATKKYTLDQTFSVVCCESDLSMFCDALSTFNPPANVNRLTTKPITQDNILTPPTVGIVGD